MKNIHIHFGHLEVNSINGSSGVFFGSNVQIHFHSASKANNGISINGHENKLINNIDIVKDDDGLEITSTQSN
ncbi:hypothetical protein [Mesobacillus maritimus]|uniref:hypothetical protein n=1 Tax=Mesobacillus maritimus TaxID=1643336 RepID=UPI003850CF2F